MSISVVSGQMSYKLLTNKMPAVEYATAKVHIWMNMLNRGQRPKKWLKANSKGTKVNFDYIKSEAEYEKGLIDLQVYIDEINSEFGLEIKIARKEL
ncbi:hypothetical protein ABC382_00135 [Lysinibacillus sp. 1P01SD]|uniref:hypothetical protein n=1 Tax=Lysinibacillus sp. 1P01SD TaxID=3132285 RepID=UPI0039A0AC85